MQKAEKRREKKQAKTLSVENQRKIGTIKTMINDIKEPPHRMNGEGGGMNDVRVGYQLRLNDEKVKPVNLICLLEKMHTSETLKKLVDTVRSAPSDDARRAAKMSLPCFTISADTDTRAITANDKHTGLAIIDIDGKDHDFLDLADFIGEVEELKKSHTYIIDYFISPSGDGLKVICGVEPDTATHSRSYLALMDTFASVGIITDSKCKNLKRVCYMSHDTANMPRVIQSLMAWDGSAVTPKPERKATEYKITRSTANTLSPDEEIELCLEHLSPDDYQDWVEAGMIAKSHGASIGVWESWSQSGQSYKPGECEKKWSGFNGDSLQIGTLIERAKSANGGINPISQAKNTRTPVVIDVNTDFDEIADSPEAAVVTINSLDDIHFYKRQYYTLNADATEYISFGAEDLTRMLRIMGYSPKGADGEVSAIDKIKNMIITEQYVHYVGVIAGRSIGVVENENGIRHLVTRQNRRINASEGEWPTINTIINSIFGDGQRDYFFAWLHRSRRQLERQSYMQGHALVIAGGVGKGKSLIQETIVSKLLGASARASLYLTGGTTFNADLVSSETLTIDDDGGDRDAKSRRVYGDRLKMITAGSKSVQCHGKGVDGYMVEPLWRICVCMNDDDQSLGAFPAIGEGDCDSVGDKILMLKCLGLAPIPFTGKRNQSALLEAAIRRDLPGFAYFIDNYKIPPAIQRGDCRFGFDEYHHPELLATVNQDSNERTLLSVTDHLLFDNKGDFSEAIINLDHSTSRYYWEGSAVEWANILLSANRMPQYRTVSGMLAFGDNAIKAGKAMRSMSKISDGRVINRRGKRDKTWIIWERSDVADSVENDPF